MAEKLTEAQRRMLDYSQRASDALAATAPPSVRMAAAREAAAKAICEACREHTTPWDRLPESGAWLEGHDRTFWRKTAAAAIDAYEQTRGDDKQSP